MVDGVPSTIMETSEKVLGKFLVLDRTHRIGNGKQKPIPILSFRHNEQLFTVTETN